MTVKRVGARPGRPTSLADGYNPKTGDWHPNSIGGKLIHAIALGMPYRQACNLAGVTGTAFFEWKARGDAHRTNPDVNPRDVIYSDFADRATHARAAGVQEALELWHSHFAQDWRAIAKWLAVVDPDSFAERKEVRVSGDPEHPLEVVDHTAIRDALAADPAAALALRNLALVIETGATPVDVPVRELGAGDEQAKAG